MKKIGLILLIASFVACGQNKPKDEKLIRGGGLRDGNNAAAAKGNMPLSAAQANNTGIWGMLQMPGGQVNILGQNYNYNGNDLARVFLYTDWPVGVVGATTTQADPNFSPDSRFKAAPCVPGSNCEARVTFGYEGGEYHQPLQTDSNFTYTGQSVAQRVNIVGGGVTLGFWDSLTGTTATSEDGSQVTLTPIPVYVPIDPSGSYLQSNRLVMNFRDSKGTITVDGQLSGSTYSGTIRFTNAVDFDGKPFQTSAQLGSFQVYACSVLKCQ